MIRSHLHGSHRRKGVRFFTAAVLALPVAIPVATPAEAACTLVWSSPTTVSRQGVVLGNTYTSTVTYQAQYDTCSMARPVRLKVVSFKNVMKIAGKGPYSHVDWQASVTRWFDRFPSVEQRWAKPLAYADYQRFSHYGDGTWSRGRSPNVIIPFDSRAAVMDEWKGCGYYGQGTCVMAYRFYIGDLDVEGLSGV